MFRAESAAEAEGLLGDWLHAAAYCRIKPVVEVEKKVRRRRADVVAAVELGIGNGRAESINQKIFPPAPDYPQPLPVVAKNV